MNQLYDYHVHLYGVLRSEDIFELGKDRYKQAHLQTRIRWCEQEFSRNIGRPLSISDFWQKEDGFERLCRDYLMLEAGDFNVFQAKFNILIALFGITNPDDFTVIKHILQQQLEAGIQGAEYRMIVPPSLDRLGQQRFFTGLCHLMAEFHAVSAGSFQPTLALSLARDEQQCLGDYALVQHLRQSPQREFLRAIDFCQDEAGHPPSKKVALIDQVLREDPDLLILYHVGETFNGMSIMSSIRWVLQAAEMGCHRLGHCLSLGYEPKLLFRREVLEPVSERLAHLDFLDNLDAEVLSRMQLNHSAILAEKSSLQALPAMTKIRIYYDHPRLVEIEALQNYVMQELKERSQGVIEVCPSSNLRIAALPNLASHPYWRFRKAGLRLVVGSDDPGIFATDLKQEILLCNETTAL